MDSNIIIFSKHVLTTSEVVFLCCFFSNQVVDSYGYGFESGYLVSNFDLIVVNVDARGTCCRGER